ncbi:MAG: HAD-IIB family hydrolase [Patescibacteria group bacterium]
MTAYSKQLIIFDKDGTLTPSKSPIDPEMTELLLKLLERKKVAIISGSGFPLFENQILKVLPSDTKNLSSLLILPVSGTRLYTWRGSWAEQYSEHLSPKEKEKIMASINSSLRQANYESPQKIYGDMIEDRGSQITFSAFGQNAPLELKTGWDPNREKRAKIVSFLQPKIPEFDIHIGGTTSIDITKKGVNKGYGIRKLEEYLKMPLDDMIFVGDALFPGGNDYPAKATGVDCIQVSGPEETKKLIASWIV